MTKNILFLIFSGISSVVMAQNLITGRVTDRQDQPIFGANIYIEGTYDGASTDEDGTFFFESELAGIQTLVISTISFESHYRTGDLKSFQNLHIKLEEAINELKGVTLSAGTFEAGDNAKVAVLKPLDIVTTAGAAGDFVAALQTLPGTATVNEDGRLFVRGGAAGETQLFIDGLRVFQPYQCYRK